jgi:beta-N-acetylhexosaminidase
MMKKVLFNTIVFFILFFLPMHGLYADDDVIEYINGLTLPEKIGQLMLIGFQGKTLSSKDMTHLKKLKPGGIVFYGRNFEDASDIPPLIIKIQSIFQNKKLPLFFAIDQEGGIVHRIEGQYQKPPSAPSIGAINSEDLAREVGLAVGNALRELGININFAPVLDVPTDLLSSPLRRRSYSIDSRTVAQLGTAYITGLRNAGILSTAKHFPGIGRTYEDTHYTLPHIKWKTTNEKDSDIMPFQYAIKTGVDMIMVGHVTAEPGDSGNPVSLSSYWMTDVLREVLDFKGLVLVDNIEMKPIEDIMPISEAAVQSFKAGADIIMVSHRRKTQEEVFNSLMNAVNKGDITLERLNESLRRIIEAKKKILSRDTLSPNKNLRELSMSVAEETVTILTLRDFPFYTINKNDTVLFIGNNKIISDAMKYTFKHTYILDTSLSNYKKLYPETSFEEFIKKIDALLIEASYTDAAHIISLCNRLNKKYFVLQSYFSDIHKTIERLRPKQIIITYESDRENLHVVFEILMGLRKAKGRLPSYVIIPTGYTYISSKKTGG